MSAYPDPVVPVTHTAAESGITASVPPPASSRFDEATALISATLPVSLDRSEQVTKNSYNWRGPSDSSCHADIGFSPQALIINGEIIDDCPLVQSRNRPLMDDWWKLTYGGDGLELEFDDSTSTARRLNFLFNFSSAGTSPKIEVLQSPTGLKANPSPGSELTISELPDAIRREGTAGFRFRAMIPIERLAEPGFFTGPLHIITRLHDLDGDTATYLMMQDVIEKP